MGKYVLLHSSLLVYSLSILLSKFASRYEILSRMHVLFYCFVLIALFAYALSWQQILKKIPLSVAFAHKSVIVIWGLLWGFIFFSELPSLKMLVGSIIIIIGIILVSYEFE